MHVVRKSQLTGVEHSMDLPVTEDQMLEYLGGALLQDAFPQLNADQREFLHTGITPEEWKTLDDEEES